MCRRRGHNVVISRLDPSDDFRRFGVTFYDDRFTILARLKRVLFAIEAQGFAFGLTGRRIGAVTGITVFRKNRLDLVVEGNLIAWRGQRAERRAQQKQ
jgi:hypothetical protein